MPVRYSGNYIAISGYVINIRQAGRFIWASHWLIHYSSRPGAAGIISRAGNNSTGQAYTIISLHAIRLSQFRFAFIISFTANASFVRRLRLRGQFPVRIDRNFGHSRLVSLIVFDAIYAVTAN